MAGRSDLKARLAPGLGSAFAALIDPAIGCHVTEYPVIFDSRGPCDGNGPTGAHDQAYIILTGRVGSIWSDGSDELHTVVQQDWADDQWLRTYDRFDPTASAIFLDQTCCDPLRQPGCPPMASWNPNLPNRSFGNTPPCDEAFDDDCAPQCAGARSLRSELAMASRMGECGSGLWGDKRDSRPS